jgi:hypothetical protein
MRPRQGPVVGSCQVPLTKGAAVEAAVGQHARQDGET